MSDTLSENTNTHPIDVSFLRKKDYKIIKILGKGACGQTVLLLDELIDQKFVCKKYHPYSEKHRREFFEGFMREIKLLHQIQHKNVVRIFNYFAYPSNMTGFILMEHVDGVDIQTHATNTPEHLNQLFMQAVNGFRYLEEVGILHRDIRPYNLMVSKEGELKIIDLGFGKQIASSSDFDKSISLNWWCETPDEFEDQKYDWTTEVYFVGKLFEKLIKETSFDSFSQTEVLRQMCKKNPAERLASFSQVENAIHNPQITTVGFTDDQTIKYRRFSEELVAAIDEIEKGAKFANDHDKLARQLSDYYRNVMLEEFVPSNGSVLKLFVDGGFYYHTAPLIKVSTLKSFIDLLHSCTKEQSRIVMANLVSKIDAVPQYMKSIIDDNEIPF